MCATPNYFLRCCFHLSDITYFWRALFDRNIKFQLRLLEHLYKHIFVYTVFCYANNSAISSKPIEHLVGGVKAN